MKTIKMIITVFSISLIAASCVSHNGQSNGESTPIDSTNVKGTAPATYGGNNPANDERDSNRNNINDTGTKANNVHNAGTYSNTSTDSIKTLNERNKAEAQKSMSR